MRERGYSLPEMLTVVAIVGMIAIVGIPAFMVLMPQYRVRSAASELAATVRRTRENALSTRRPWRVTFDTTNNRYAVSELNVALNPSTHVELQTNTNWVPVDLNYRPVGAFTWTTLPSSIRLSTNNLLDVDCDSGTDLIFLLDGTVATDWHSNTPHCTAGGSAALTFPAGARLHYDSSLVTYNTYYIEIPIVNTLPGPVSTRATKE
ncbi:MAG TPA: prepilin-type N-terminal cleavage/methylation domain-containing protein [Thermoanaerobaculia bacterium]|nr:prepilin-type N-terminal cleavage/methylation domain-containing protein [Thermoanaerobaculia bacterium]